MTDPHINPATGVWDDNFFAQNYGGGGRGADDVIQQSINKIGQQLDDYKNKLNEFGTKNPFNFDNVLKEETAKVKQRLDPYYNKVIGDYIQGAETTKNRSLEDERRLMGYLNQDMSQYNQDQKDILRNTLDQTGQSYALQGMESSGFLGRAEGNQAADTQQAMQKNNQSTQRQMEQTQLQGDRLRNYDIPLAVSQKKNEVGAEQTSTEYAQTYSQAQQRQNQYNFVREQYAGGGPNAGQSWDTDVYKLLGNPSSSGL